MKTYEFISNKFNCLVRVNYNNQGKLMGFFIQTENHVCQDDLRTVLGNLIDEQFFLIHSKQRGIKVTLIPDDLSFARFWNEYGYKDGGSKKKAEAIWNRLPEAQKAKAIAHISRFKQAKNLQQTAMPYATTYLNSEPWNN